MWYHISDNFLGKEVILNPKIPQSAKTKIEGNIPRICVSDSIYYCIKSLAGRATYNAYIKHFHGKPGKVYTLIRNPAVYCCRETPYLPPDAADFRENREHWYIKPTKFTFLGYLDSRALLRRGKLRICNFLVQKVLTKEIKRGNIFNGGDNIETDEVL